MTNMKKTLLRGGCIVSIDRSIGILPTGDLLIIGDKIAAVAPRIEATADEVIDALGKILIPGLVNAHLHTWQSGLRSIGGGWTGPDYHRLMHANMATRFRPDDNYIGTLFGALDQLNGGVTTILDWCHDITSIEHAYRSVDALQEAGVRATPHTFRHQAITWLTRHSGLADAELQLITGHARRETLAVYQHVALDGDLEAKYQATMKQVEL